MKRLINKVPFIKVLFDTIPAWVFVLDSECRVNAVNQAARDFTQCNEGDAHLGRHGNVIGCAHHREDPRGCGYSRHCITCIIRNSALEAIQGNATHRTKGKLDFLTGKALNVFVSSAPFDYEGQMFAVTIIEDISLIVKLEGLIPICASCKKIRDDKGYWNRIEMYIEAHSEVEFTHDICPDCIERLYPTLSNRSTDMKIG